jgi:hypothetical protein
MITRCERCNKLFSTKVEEFKVFCENCEKILQEKDEELEIFNLKEKLTLGIRLSKENSNNIEVYMFNPYFGHGMQISVDDAIKLRNKLDSLIEITNK